MIRWNQEKRCLEHVHNLLSKQLLDIYNALYKHFGPQHWWPGETPFEIAVGAILTQNTAWKNVEKAISNLKKAGLLEPCKLAKVPLNILAELIRPAGFFNLKAKRLKNFLDFLCENYDGSLERMFQEETERLRKRLLRVKGIGPETADSILLYAGNKPSFVVDAYTRRIFVRHNLISEDMDYEEIRRFFMDHLPEDVSLFNEYHALIVALGKTYCRPKPRCQDCILREFL